MCDHRDKAANQLQQFKDGQPKCPAVHTVSNGAPTGLKTAIQTVGPRGPALLQDFVYQDEMAAFGRERIPERVVHAKGSGAHGEFEVTHDITRYTKIAMFNQIGKKTPLLARFSTVGGENGSADTARDPRGFAVKFYTEEGNWDMVGNNTPIFFIRDPTLFPSFIHTQKRNPRTHCKDPDMFWDFISLRPETTHQVAFLFSDRGTPDGYRHMNGYGSHTFKLINDKDEMVYTKFHFKTDQGIKNLSTEKAGRLAGEDPDYALRDLFNAIEDGEFPSWTLYIQVMTFEQAETWKFDPFDLTKVWGHKDFPLIPVGRMTLNRNPLNYFRDIEQSAFAPSHMVPGVEPSPCKMLQGRLFSYVDTHRHRLGSNYQQIPVNCPYRARLAHYQRDGPQCVTDNQGDAPNYYPNSFSGPVDDPQYIEPTYHVSGDVKRYDTKDEHNFEQVGIFYRETLNEAERKNLCQNLAGHMKDAQEFIQKRAVANFAAADAELGRGIQVLLDEYNKANKKGPVMMAAQL